MLGLSVTVNHRQKRIKRRAQWVVASGIDFDGDQDLRSFSNAWINGINHRLTLRPGPMFDAWWSSDTGIYAKIGLAGLTGQTGACIESEDFPGAGKYLVYQDADVAVMTSAIWVKNTGAWVSVFADSAGDRHEIARGGWSNAGVITMGVGWLLYSDGSIDLFKNGVFLSTYRISGSVDHGSVQNKRVGLMMIPQAGRELLVVSTEGHGFSHVFGDIDEDELDPVITPPEKFWISVAAASTHFQIAKIQYPTSGYAVTRALSFAEDPTELVSSSPLSPYIRIFYSFTDGPATLHPAPTFELRNWANNATFLPVGTLPDGSPDLRCRVRVNLISDGTYTPVVFGCVPTFRPLVAWTNDSEAVCIDAHITEWTADLCEDRAGRQWTLTLKAPEALMALHALGFNLPVRIKFSEGSSTGLDDGDIVMVDGYSEAPEWEAGVGDDVQRCTWVIREPFSELEHTESQDIWPHDLFPFTEAIAWDLADVAIGLPGPGETEEQGHADLDFDPTDLILGGGVPKDANDWIILRDVGVSGAADIQQIMNDNAGSWLAQFLPKKHRAASPRPRPFFVIRSPESQAAAPVAGTLYREKLEAIAAGEGDLAVNSWNRSTLQPEATEVGITWMDPRTNRIHREKKRDSLAQDPTIAPSARPSNWLGTIRLAGMATDQITLSTVAADALEYLYDRLTAAPEIGEAGAQMLFWPDAAGQDGRPVYVGDKITIGDVTSKICSIHLRGFKEPNEHEASPVRWREATYVLGNGSGNTSGGSTLKSIIEANKQRAAESKKYLIRPRLADVVRQTPTQVIIRP